MRFRKIVENILEEAEKKKKDKEYKSKKIFDKDSGYNVSLDEEYIYDKLKKKWPDTIQSYTDDRFVSPETHRHFQCDFYIPSLDWFCNYDKHIKHGRRPYNPADENCIKDAEWLKNKAKDSEFYEKMYHTWTIVDPIKRDVAKENGFRFIEWFNLDEFDRWYEDPNLTYYEYQYAPKSLQYDSDEYFRQKNRGRDVYGNDSDPYGR